jgi:hypothetical protein
LTARSGNVYTSSNQTYSAGTTQAFSTTTAGTSTVTRLDIAEPELCGDSQFLTPAGWTYDTNFWTLGFGALFYQGSGTATKSVSKDIDAIAGRTYTVTYEYYLEGVGVQFRANVGGTGGALRLASGTYTDTIVAGTNGISPIFLTTVSVTGGIGLDLKNWVKKTDADGKVVTNASGDPVLEQVYSVETGTVLTINTKEKKLYGNGKVLADISSAFTPQKLEFIKAGGSYAIVFGKKLQTFAAETLGITPPVVYALAKEVSHQGQGLTAVEKIFNRNAVGTTPGLTLHAGSDVRVKVNIVGSQDTTGLMTSQQLEAMAATVISPTVDADYQSGCHTASVWD